MTHQLIIVVEDNPDHLELTVLTLKEHGFAGEIAMACDGAGALDFLFGQGEHTERDTRHHWPGNRWPRDCPAWRLPWTVEVVGKGATFFFTLPSQQATTPI